jgi:tetratricopeptide (TPR) repeat protein
MANVLHDKANLEGELDRYEAATRSDRRRVELLRDLVPLDPHPPQYLEELAMAEQHLGVVLHLSNHPPKTHDPPAEEQFRKARDMFAELQRRWPDRPQPQVLSARHLAHFARNRGDVAEAERLLKLAIDRGENFSARRPDDTDEIYETAWACTILYDLLAESSDDRTIEAEATLQRGLRPLSVLLEKNADNLQAVDVACALWIRLGLCYCRQERAGDAIPVFNRAIEEMEKLCEAFPWNEYYWGNLTWFHDDAATTLTSANRADEAAAMLRAYRKWLQDVAAHLPEDAGPRDKQRRNEKELVRMFRAAGLDGDADELMRSHVPSPAEPQSGDPPD